MGYSVFLVSFSRRCVRFKSELSCFKNVQNIFPTRYLIHNQVIRNNLKFTYDRHENKKLELLQWQKHNNIITTKNKDANLSTSVKTTNTNTSTNNSSSQFDVKIAILT